MANLVVKFQIIGNKMKETMDVIENAFKWAWWNHYSIQLSKCLFVFFLFNSFENSSEILIRRRHHFLLPTNGLKLRPTCIALHWWSPQLYSYYSYSIYQTLTNRITRGASEGGRGDTHDMQTMLYTGLFPTRYFVSQYICKLFLPFFYSPWNSYTHYLHLSQYIQS